MKHFTHFGECIFLVNGICYLSRQDGQPAALLQQNDLFFSKLTPKETLSLATFLQLTSLGIEDRKERVRNIMTELGLSRVEHRLTGESASSSWSRDNGLSGGERRRLSVGTLCSFIYTITDLTIGSIFLSMFFAYFKKICFIQ